jgi:hypothetical protein
MLVAVGLPEALAQEGGAIDAAGGYDMTVLGARRRPAMWFDRPSAATQDGAP